MDDTLEKTRFILEKPKFVPESNAIPILGKSGGTLWPAAKGNQRAKGKGRGKGNKTGLKSWLKWREEFKQWPAPLSMRKKLAEEYPEHAGFINSPYFYNETCSALINAVNESAGREFEQKDRVSRELGVVAQKIQIDREIKIELGDANEVIVDKNND